MNALAHQLTSVAAGVAITAGFCVVLERWFGPQRGIRGPRFGWRTDLTYAVATPLLVRVIRRFAIGLALVPVALALGHGLDVRALLRGFGPLASQARWLQGLEMLMIGDFIGYWVHRGFHRGALWRFHAVHHSSPRLDWLAAFRVHPVNDVVAGICRAVPLVALGFSPMVLAGVLPLLTLHAIVLHADVDWTFGRLRTVLASPAFHRWHHTAEAAGRDRNFAGLLPVWDIVFGTFWMPGRRCARVGIDEAMPAGWLAQFVWPFRRGAVGG